ncbi:MAG TPA: hypothetical protein V6D47_06380 [Oscillatoriaceae cyanobacterium]
MTLTDYPQLQAFIAQLDAQAGRLTADDAPAAIAVLTEYLESGAKLGRSLREVTARFRPADPVGVAISYLFVVVVDAANHQGREHTLAAYAAQADAPLAKEAGELYALLTSDRFGQLKGARPIVGGHRGCTSA